MSWSFTLTGSKSCLQLGQLNSQSLAVDFKRIRKSDTDSFSACKSLLKLSLCTAGLLRLVTIFSMRVSMSFSSSAKKSSQELIMAF